MQILINQNKTYVTKGTIYPVKVLNGKWAQCNESEKQGYMIVEENCVYPQDCILVEVTEIPSYVTPQKYIYDNGAFKENPNYVAPPPTAEELTTQISNMQEVLDFMIQANA